MKNIIKIGTRKSKLALIQTDIVKDKIKKGELKPFGIRLNTIGLGNLVHGRDITGDLAKVLDKINISINSPYKEEWQALVRPKKEYQNEGFDSVLDFTRLCAQKMSDVTLTIVDKQNIDVEKTKQLAESRKEIKSGKSTLVHAPKNNNNQEPSKKELQTISSLYSLDN